MRSSPTPTVNGVGNMKKEVGYAAALSIVLAITVGIRTTHTPSVALGSGSEMETQRVSVSSDGTQADGASGRPVLSVDGRFVSFSSNASNLVEDDTNGSQDIFVFDRAANQIERVSVSSTGAQANDDSFSPAISTYGRYVAFSSAASNITPGDANGIQDVFVLDRITGETDLVSQAIGGESADDYSGEPSISADGRYVAFSSSATNLVPGDTNGESDIFLYDRELSLMRRISLATDGGQSDGDSQGPTLSHDGRYVGFYSNAANLIPGDTNGEYDVFLYDLVTGETELVSLSSDGSLSDDYSHSPSVSSNGQYVAFQSWATNLVPGDTNGKADTFVHDRLTIETFRVSVASDGSQGQNGGTHSAIISNDGRYVAFESFADNLVTDDTNNSWDIFVRDLALGVTERVSVSPSSAEGNGSSQDVAFSGDGRVVGFKSAADNLVSGDTNEIQDVFVRGERGLGQMKSANMERPMMTSRAIM